MKVRPLCSALQQKAEEELQEIPSQVQENLTILKDWLNKQKHLKYKNDDQFLLNFLRASKHRMERAKSRIVTYYTFRTVAPEYAFDLDPFLPNVQAFLKGSMCIPLPIPPEDPASGRVLLMRFGNYDPDEVTQLTMMKAGYVISEFCINEDDNFVIAGIKLVCDMKGGHLKTVLQMTPSLLKKALYWYENGFPNRIKSVHFLNVPKVYEQIITGLKLLFPKKLVEKFHFYSDNKWEAIYNDIPKSILPFEYGGTAGFVDDLGAKWKETIENHRDVLLNENNYYSVGARDVHIENVLDGFGVQGTFRRLEID